MCSALQGQWQGMVFSNLEHKYGGKRALRKARSHPRLSRAEYRELGMRRAQEHANCSPFQIKTLSKWKDLILSEATSTVIKEKKEMSEEDRKHEIFFTCLHLLDQDSEESKDRSKIDFNSVDVGLDDELWDHLMACAEEVATLGEMESQLVTVSLKQKQMRNFAIFQIAKVWVFMADKDLMSEAFPRYETPFV